MNTTDFNYMVDKEWVTEEAIRSFKEVIDETTVLKEGMRTPTVEGLQQKAF